MSPIRPCTTLGIVTRAAPTTAMRDQDLEREAEREGVERGGRAGQQTQPDVGQQEHREDRPGDLGRGQQQPGRRPGQGLGHGAEGDAAVERDQLVRRHEPLQHNQIAAGRQEQRQRRHLVELAHHRVAALHQRVVGEAEREAAGDVDQVTGGLYGGEDQVAQEAQGGAGQHLPDQRRDDRRGVGARQGEVASGRAAAAPSATDSRALIGPGTAREANGGAITSQAAARAEPSSSTSRTWAGTSTLTGSAGLQDGGHLACRAGP